MPVDYAAAWLALKESVVDRQGIGRDALFALMGRLEVEHQFDEEVVERLIRRYGVVLGEDLRSRARVEHESTESPPRSAAGPQSGMTSGLSHRKDQEVRDEHHRSTREAAAVA